MTANNRQHAPSIIAAFILACGTIVHAADPYAEALRYKFDQPRTAVWAIEAEIRSATPAQLRVIEGRLLAILQSPEAHPDAKAWVCRQLRLAGSEQSAPALGALLSDKQLAAPAQFALRSIPGPKADEVLRTALGTAPADLKAGVIQTIGARGDRQAIALLAPLAADADATTAKSALAALGQIGGPDALKAVEAAQAPPALARARARALLLCAESLRQGNQASVAARVYENLYQEQDLTIKSAALRGLAATDESKAAPILLAALRDAEDNLRAAAAQCLGDLASAQLLGQVLADFAALPADVQITILSAARNPTALPAARASIKNVSPPVRLAALGLLKRRGGDSDVPLLLDAAAGASGEEQAAARSALQTVPARNAHSLLIAAAEKGEPSVRAEAIRTLAARQAASAVPALLKLAADPVPAVRRESFKALGGLAGADDLPSLLNLLARAGDDLGVAESAAAAVCERAANKEAAVAMVLAALPNAGQAERGALVKLLPLIATGSGLNAVRADLNHADGGVKNAALEALAAWPNADAVPDLLGAAKNAGNEANRSLAFRNCVRLVREGQTAVEAKLGTLNEIAPLTKSAADKKLVLAALGEVPLPGAVELVLTYLPDSALEMEAATAVASVAPKLRGAQREPARAAVEKIQALCQNPAARQKLEGALLLLGGMANIALEGTASSPDGWEKDGEAGGDQAGIDGKPETYWDEDNGKKLYRYVVTFKEPRKIAALSIMGWAHHNFAPRDFEVLCDDKPVKKVTKAAYADNHLLVQLPETRCTTVELKITGYYGQSPAIRELGIYASNGSPAEKK